MMIEQVDQATRLVVKRRSTHVNVFNEVVEDSVDLPAPPPVRVILVTDEMRRRDAEQQRTRAAASGSDWRIKSELRAENLKGWSQARVQPGRIQPKAAQVRLPKAAPVRAHRMRKVKPAEPEPVVPVLEPVVPVPEPIEIIAPVAIEQVETVVPTSLPERCACGTKIQLRLRSRRECSDCYAVTERIASRVPPGPKCSSPMCTRTLRSDNTRKDGFCGKCGDLADRAGRVRRDKRCEVCYKPLRNGTGSNTCYEHRGKFKTVMVAASRTEWELDKAWASLPVRLKAVAIADVPQGVS